MRQPKYVDILYSRYLNEKHEVTIGGVQTYITDLCQICLELDIKVRIVQFASQDFVYDMPNGVKCFGFYVSEKKAKKRYQILYDKSVMTRDSEDTITLFATDNIIPRKVKGRALAIQHGIFWDMPAVKERFWLKQILARMRHITDLKQRMDKIETLICVDYNFVNWYRTQVDTIKSNVKIIPNYTKIMPPINKPDDVVNIIFARRLFNYRGTRVFTSAIKMVLENNSNVRVTIAGSGPDEQFMKDNLSSFSNVIFTKYESNESLYIHKTQHIAVVPSTGSEGTSLSLLEAMSAQCAVVCTDIGGLTNIVLDGFNGKMVEAGSVEQLYEAIKFLIENADERQRLAENGYQTVKSAFSKEKWVQSWKRVFEAI